MTRQPLVSVIVPSFNYGHFLGQTLASVQAQTLGDWECLVVDDGSTDDTWDVVLAEAQKDARIQYLRRGNGGLAAARNTGLGAAKGAYVQFLDADDAIEPRKLEAHVAYLQRQPEVGIVYGDVRYFDSDTGVRRRGLFADEEWMPAVAGSGERVLRTLVRANIMVVNSPLVRRTVIDEVGRFDETLTSLEDWDYWIRCATAGAWFEYREEEETLALVRVHRRSMSQNRIEMRRQQIKIRKQLQSILTSEAIGWENRWWLAEELAQLGEELFRRGDRLGGARCFAEAVRAHPAGERANLLKRGLYELLTNGV
ncbi:MAG: glycosyltransferase [Polyangia bacterium]